MLDVSVWELGVLALVALIFIGPERLPAVAKLLGRLMGKIGRFKDMAKSELDKQTNTDQLKQNQQKAEQASQSEKKSHEVH